jgi:PST family polysaccharide transporter
MRAARGVAEQPTGAERRSPGLARAAVRGAGATFFGQWGRFLIQTGATVVLARLLTPEDYGLVGMVLAITGLADRLRTMGLSTATVQVRTIDQPQLSALFWINTGLGVLVAALLAAAAPLIARFYGEPQLTLIVLALSLSFIFGGVGAQHVALLNRRMQFRSLAGLEITSMLFGAGVAIAAALLGAGYWSLVLFHLLQPVWRGIVAWRKSRWTPSRPARADGLRGILTFGANLSGYEIIVYLSRNLDNVLIGRYLGAAPLGIYSKAYGLLLLPIQQIQGPLHRVAVSTLSRLQDDPERFRAYFRTGLGGVAFTAIPLIGFLALAADEIILLVLGSQWSAAGPVFRILAFAGLASAMTHSNSWIYIALGRTRSQMLWGLATNPLIVASFVVGLRGGVRGVALAYAVTVWLLLLPSFWYATRGTPVSVGDVLDAVARPAAVSAVAFVAAWYAGTLRPGASTLVGLAISATVYLVTAGSLVAIWPAARERARELIDLTRNALRRSA